MKCKAIFVIEFLTEELLTTAADKIAEEIGKMPRVDHGSISIEACSCLPSPAIVDMTSKLDS